MKPILLFGLTLVPLCASAEDRPNVLFIMADDIGIGDFSCYGAELISTPIIDKFAAANVQFMNAYSACSISNPTRFSVLTGYSPYRNDQSFAEGLYPNEMLAINPEIESMGSMFKKRGYATAAIGKWHLGYGDLDPVDFEKPLKPGPNELGFDYHFGLFSNHNDNVRTYIENHELVNRVAGVKFEVQTPTRDVQGIYPERKDDEVGFTLANKLKQFIRENRERPFFVYYTPTIAHTHITPQAKYRGISEAGLYGDYVHELDQQIGELLTLLDELQIADNTIVVICSDNGGQQFDYGPTAGKGMTLASYDGHIMEKVGVAKRTAYNLGHKTCGDYRGYKATSYDGGFRIPFMVRWPGKTAEGLKSYAMISTMDLMRTFAGVLDVKLPKNAAIDSYDFMPAAVKGADADDVYQIRNTNILFAPNRGISYREGDWKYIRSKNSPTDDEMYNIAEDPYETENVINQHPDIATHLAEQINQIAVNYKIR